MKRKQMSVRKNDKGVRKYKGGIGAPTLSIKRGGWFVPDFECHSRIHYDDKARLRSRAKHLGMTLSKYVRLAVWCVRMNEKRQKMGEEAWRVMLRHGQVVALKVQADMAASKASN